MAEYLETLYKKFIFKVKVGYLYSQEDFWADISGKTATIGLSDYLQKSKGDVAFLEMIESGTQVKVGQELGKIETIKATFGIITPVSGKVIEVNTELETSPELINNDPYGAGWIYKIELNEPEKAKSILVEADGYMQLMTEKIEKEGKKLYG
jgi:glycine cleavage system H protein